MEWIKVDDKFFRSGSIGDCLLLFENGDVRRLLERWLPFDIITHWMPLPAPPTKTPPPEKETDNVLLAKAHAGQPENR